MINNNKHMNFAEEYIRNGYIAVDAYAFAFPKANHTTCLRNGSALAKRPDVKEYIDARIEENRRKFDVSREEIIKEIKELIIDAKTDKDRKSIFKALDMLNKMASNYIQKVEAKVDGIIALIIAMHCSLDHPLTSTSFGFRSI